MSGKSTAVAVYHAHTQAEHDIVPGAYSVELHTYPPQRAANRERQHAVAVA
jgi:hypothetical protein